MRQLILGRDEAGSAQLSAPLPGARVPFDSFYDEVFSYEPNCHSRWAVDRSIEALEKTGDALVLADRRETLAPGQSSEFRFLDNVSIDVNSNQVDLTLGVEVTVTLESTESGYVTVRLETRTREVQQATLGTLLVDRTGLERMRVRLGDGIALWDPFTYGFCQYLGQHPTSGLHVLSPAREQQQFLLLFQTMSGR